MTNKTLLILAAALSVAGLTACSGSDPEPAPYENIEDPATSSPVEERTPEPPATEAAPPPVAEARDAGNAADETPPEEAPAPDEQMLDDAAATGMTARVTRDEATTPDAVPAEQVEQK